MNASLQCLANLPAFAGYFTLNKYLDNIDPKELEDNNGIFIKKFAKFLKRLYKYKPNSSFEPWSLKMQISYFIKIFKGYDQQDANDLSVYVLNTLNDFSMKPENSNYAQFLIDTF
jgi:ubiquitin C-terminal hydrolase